MPLTIRKFAGAAARPMCPLALLRSLPEAGTLPGQEREPGGRRAPKPGLPSKGPGRGRAARGALSLPPGSPRRAPASGRLRAPEPGADLPEPPGSLPQRGEPCAALPARVQGLLRRAPRDLTRRAPGTRAPPLRPFNQTLPEAAAAAARTRQERGGGEGNRRVFPALPLPARRRPPRRPPPTLGGGDTTSSPPARGCGLPGGGRTGNRQPGWTEPT